MTTSRRNARARPPRPASRVRHYEGERLTSGDLTEDSAYESWLRALHVRAAHDTWGVALGFSLAVNTFARQVDVGPGLGYDACAREILLSEAVTLDLPDGADLEQFEFRPYDLVCFAESTRGPMRPGFRLADPEQPVRLGVEIPLGTIWLYRWDSVTYAFGPDLGVRRSARAAIRPHIEFARLDGGELNWTDISSGSRVVFNADVETTQSAFQSDPGFLVWLVDHPWRQRQPPWVSVTYQWRGGFGLQLVFDEPIDTNGVTGFTILWVGVESTEGQWPEVGEADAAAVVPFVTALRTGGGAALTMLSEVMR